MPKKPLKAKKGKDDKKISKSLSSNPPSSGLFGGMVKMGKKAKADLETYASGAKNVVNNLTGRGERKKLFGG